MSTNGKSSRPPAAVKSSRPPSGRPSAAPTSNRANRSSRPPGVKSSSPPAGARSSRPPGVKSSSPPRPSSSPPRKRKRLRKEEILAEATLLFAERGYEGTSMGDLAARVGLRKASLFHHFPSKDALYALVLTSLLASVQTAIVSAATAPASFEDRLDALSDALTTTLGGKPHAARLIIREVMDWGPLMRGELGETAQLVLAAALEFAKAGQREGVFDSRLDPSQMIVTLIGLHFMPFALGDLVERFVGQPPSSAAFIEARRLAVRAQIRALVLRASG